MPLTINFSIGTRIQVTKQESLRQGLPEWEFCNKGKKGEVVRYYCGCVRVLFAGGKTADCSPMNLESIERKECTKKV